VIEKERMILRSLPVTALALFAVAASLSACTHSPGGRAAGSGLERRITGDPGAPVVVAARAVCRLIADNPDAAAAQVRGADGAPSIVVDGTAYWLFGDTVRNGPGGRQDVIPAAVARSVDVDGHDCVRLDFKKSGGLAQPMFPRLEETTAWPDGILPLDDGSVLFYMVKVRRESPFAWHVSSVGLGRMDPGTMSGVRQVEEIWGEDSGFGSRLAGVRSPVRIGDDVIVYIRTEAGANYVAKAPLARLGERDAYTYWDGARWSPRPSDARPMWPVTDGSPLPADNGVSVTYDESAQKWLAMYNGDLATITVRTADDPWGPWSEPLAWIDCRTLVDDVYPYCYSAEVHRELSPDADTVYVTFSSQKPYDVTLVELHLGVAIHEWRDAAGELRYAAASPGDGYGDAGVAFYASAGPAPGLTPVYLAVDGTYALADPGGAAPAFYAYAAPSDGPVHTQPVYRWHRDGREALASGDRAGWERGDVAFYVACVDPPSTNSRCGR
jgi:hypothetical protein